MRDKPKEPLKLEFKCSKCSFDPVEVDTSSGTLKVKCMICGNNKVKVPDQPEFLEAYGGSPLPPGHCVSILWIDGLITDFSLREWTQTRLPTTRGWRIGFKHDFGAFIGSELHLYRTSGWFKWKKRYELHLNFRRSPQFGGVYITIRAVQPKDLEQFLLIYTFDAKRAEVVDVAYLVPSDW